MRKMSIALGLIAGLWLAIEGATAEAAYLYGGGAYAQDFDTLPTTNPATTSLSGKGPHALNTAFGVSGLDGWYGANPGGSSTSTEFRAHDGSLSGSSGRGVLSLGTTGSTERALGVLSTSNQINSFGLVLQNNTGATIDSVDISFVGEQWRRGDITTGTYDSLTFAYLVSSDANANILDSGFTDVAGLSFTSPNTQTSPTNVALDGNAAGNKLSLSGTLGGLNWTAGNYLVLRWSGVDLSGQDDGLAIDTFRLTGNPVPEPSTLALLLALATAGLLVRRVRK
jgi:hypothetical protein